jgi:hypothetical protein
MQSNTSGPFYRYGLPAVLSVLLHGPLLIGAPYLGRQAPPAAPVVDLSIITSHSPPKALVPDLPRDEPALPKADKTEPAQNRQRRRKIVALPRVSQKDPLKTETKPAEASLLYATQDHPPAPQKGGFSMPSLNAQSGEAGPDPGLGRGNSPYSNGSKVILFDTLAKKKASTGNAGKVKKHTAEKPVTLSGLGLKFDFFKPDDFNQSIAAAEKEATNAERAFQHERQTDRGHGVICNTKGHWFLCEDSQIDRCNATYDGLCRYAKAREKRKLAGLSTGSK